MSIEIRHITKFYGNQKALDDVTFSVSKGELSGFLGPNGAGKSTLMKIITGYLPADQGEIYVNGEKVSVDNVEIRRHIGYLPENNPLYTDLYVAESLGIVAGFYRMANRNSRIREIIGLTGLQQEQHKKIGQLSKGYRQRVGLAQALIHDPSVLILDEPTTGLDPNQLAGIRTLIYDISREKTVILSSHILQEIEAICQRVVIINQGKMVADSPIEALKNNMIAGSQQVFVLFDKPTDAAKLQQIPGVTGSKAQSGGWLLTAGTEADIRPEIFRFAVSSGLVILEMTEKRQNLDTIFRHLTS